METYGSLDLPIQESIHEEVNLQSIVDKILENLERGIYVPSVTKGSGVYNFNTREYIGPETQYYSYFTEIIEDFLNEKIIDKFSKDSYFASIDNLDSILRNLPKMSDNSSKVNVISKDVAIWEFLNGYIETKLRIKPPVSIQVNILYDSTLGRNKHQKANISMPYYEIFVLFGNIETRTSKNMPKTQNYGNVEMILIRGDYDRLDPLNTKLYITEGISRLAVWNKNEDEIIEYLHRLEPLQVIYHNGTDPTMFSDELKVWWRK